MVLTAPEDRLYWFLFTEIDKARGDAIPRSTKEDERQLAEAHFGDKISDTMTFKDLLVHARDPDHPRQPRGPRVPTLALPQDIHHGGRGSQGMYCPSREMKLYRSRQLT